MLRIRWAGLILAVGVWFGTLPLAAQTPIVLSSSGQIVDFVTGASPGGLNVLLGSLPADDPSTLALTGSVGTSGSYSLSTNGPITLTPTGAGSYTASNAADVSLAFNAAGQSSFTEPLASLTFSQPTSGGAVYLQASATAMGGATLNIVGSIEFPPGVTLASVASSRVATDAGGPIVPEPATAWLFALGLVGCALIYRRRASRERSLRAGN